MLILFLLSWFFFSLVTFLSFYGFLLFSVLFSSLSLHFPFSFVLSLFLSLLVYPSLLFITPYPFMFWCLPRNWSHHLCCARHFSAGISISVVLCLTSVRQAPAWHSLLLCISPSHPRGLFFLPFFAQVPHPIEFDRCIAFLSIGFHLNLTACFSGASLLSLSLVKPIHCMHSSFAFGPLPSPHISPQLTAFIFQPFFYFPWFTVLDILFTFLHCAPRCLLSFSRFLPATVGRL